MFGKRSARGAGSGSRSATKPNAGGIGNGLLACILTGGSDAVASRASFTHLRSLLAFSPLANATAAIEMPGLQASMAPAFNSALCLRRWRPAGALTKLVSMYPRKVKRTLDSYISAFESICLCWLLTKQRQQRKNDEVTLLALRPPFTNSTSCWQKSSACAVRYLLI